MSRTIIQGNDRKVCYVHIPCTGGRSLIHALGLLPSHTTAARERERHPDLTHIFTVVRSPYTLLVSWYNRITGHAENIVEFRHWAANGFPHKNIPLVNGGWADPLEQLEWIDDQTTVFLYPHIQEAADWAAELVGREPRRVGQIGTWTKTVPWQDYYGKATGGIVKRRWAETFERFQFPGNEML